MVEAQDAKGYHCGLEKIQATGLEGVEMKRCD